LHRQCQAFTEVNLEIVQKFAEPAGDLGSKVTTFRLREFATVMIQLLVCVCFIFSISLPHAFVYGKTFSHIHPQFMRWFVLHSTCIGTKTSEPGIVQKVAEPAGALGASA